MLWTPYYAWKKKYRHILGNSQNFEKYCNIHFWSYRPALVFEKLLCKEKRKSPVMRQRRGRWTTVFKSADKEAELQLRGRRVDNCWRLQMMVALKYVTLVSGVLGVYALCCIILFPCNHTHNPPSVKLCLRWNQSMVQKRVGALV